MVRKALRDLKPEYTKTNYRAVLSYLPLKSDPDEDYSDMEFPVEIEKVPKKFVINFRNDYMLKKQTM